MQRSPLRMRRSNKDLDLIPTTPTTWKPAYIYPSPASIARLVLTYLQYTHFTYLPKGSSLYHSTIATHGWRLKTFPQQSQFPRHRSLLPSVKYSLGSFTAMTSTAPSFIPLFLSAMVAWKIMHSKKTSKFTGAAPSLRSVIAKPLNQTSAWGSSISERLSARGKFACLKLSATDDVSDFFLLRNQGVQRPGAKTGSERNVVSHTGGVLNKRPKKLSPSAEREKRARRS